MNATETYKKAISDIHNTETNKRLNRPDFSSDEAHAECDGRIAERVNKLNAWLEKTGRLPAEVVRREVMA